MVETGGGGIRKLGNKFKKSNIQLRSAERKEQKKREKII